MLVKSDILKGKHKFVICGTEKPLIQMIKADEFVHRGKIQHPSLVRMAQ